MAYKQPIIVPNIKEYALISGFNKGYDKNTADGFISDNTFRDMLNMYSDENGKLKKRNGHQLAYIQSLIEYYLPLNTPPYSTGNPEVNDPNYAPDLGSIYNANLFSGTVNGVAVANGSLRNTLIKELVYMKGHAFTAGSETMESVFDNIIGLHIINQNFDLENPYVELVMLIGGKIIGYADINNNSVWSEYVQDTYKYVYLKMYKETYYSEAVGRDVVYWHCDYKINYDASTYANLKYKISDKLAKNGAIKIVPYNNRLYFTTGYGLQMITNGVLTTLTGSDVFKPTAIEVTNVGFNILATNPLTWYDTTGTANTIKGVFFTQSIGGSPEVFEPVTKLPVNKPFRINVIDTGAEVPQTPEYRPDNGDTSETTNPWKPFSGSYIADIFTVTEFNLDGSFEFRVKKGTGSTEPYRGHFETGNSQIAETGRVSEIKNLINSSLYCTVIGSQLVLFGGHGYMFFSDYDNFTYFPNYYNIYVVESSDDEVVGVSYFRQYYALYTKKLMKRMSGTFGTDNFIVTKLNDFVGCYNPNTVKQVENNLLFLSNNGIYRLKQGYTGEGTENVDQIDITVLGDYDKTKIINAVVSGTRYIMTTDRGAIVYDFKQNAFYKYEYGISREEGDVTGYSPLFINNQDISEILISMVNTGASALADYKIYSKGLVTNHKNYLINKNIYSPSALLELETITANKHNDIDNHTADSTIETSVTLGIAVLDAVEVGLG